MNKQPHIAIVGNAPTEKHEMLNALLGDDTLVEMYDIALYGTDGQPDTEALIDALDDYREGMLDGIVCLPLSASLKKAVPAEAGSATMSVFIHSASRLASVKGQVSPNEVAASLTKENIIERATLLFNALKRDLRIQNPRIAITSLGSDISTGESSPEINIIAPAVSELVKSGIQAFGPVASSKCFDNENFSAYDAVLQMYNGQCNEAFCKLADDKSTTLLTGVSAPIAQTEPEALFSAITLVTDVAHNRKNYDLPLANPLQKLYREKKEDGDKARFAVKKKGFNPAEHRRENVTYIKEGSKSEAKEG